MIYKFRLLSNEEDDFLCDIEIFEYHTFLDLNDIIQETLNYDKSMITSFYLCDNNWEKKQEISLMDMESDSDKNLLMINTSINEFVKKKSDKLIYVFDLLNERGFFIELIGAIKENPETIYPNCIKLVGKIPPQTKIEDVEM